MGILNRMSILFKSKVLRIVDQAEDPRETLYYAYERQRELLVHVRRALVEVSTSRHQLGTQSRKLQDRIPGLEDQARRALVAGREDLARVALERRQLAERQLQELQQQLTEVTQEEQKLIVAERRFAAAVEGFRTRCELMTALYTAAQAQANITQTLAGVSGEMADLGVAIERAESKIRRTRARASAVDQLLSSGVFDDLSFSGDRVESELQKQQDQQKIEEQLAAMKKDLMEPKGA